MQSPFETHATELALEIFQMANRQYTTRELELFTTLLSNPLCQTMFQARTRTFSDYAESTEPLSQSKAQTLIDNILSALSYEAKIQIFFDEMNAIKPFPLSQIHTIEYQYDDKDSFITEVLRRHLPASLEGRSPIQLDELYQQLKFEIASDIEEHDYCCRDNYEELMRVVKNAITNAMPRAYATENPSNLARFSMLQPQNPEVPVTNGLTELVAFNAKLT